MKNALELHFHDGIVLGFDLSKMTEDNYYDVAQAIVTIFKRKLLLSRSVYSKYMSKNTLIPNCNFDLKLFIDGVVVNSHLHCNNMSYKFMECETSVSELLCVMFDDALDKPINSLLKTVNSYQN